MATHVIIGASLAGATAAITLRERDPSGRIVLIGEEPEAPYERPPLSKSYLRGDTAFDQALLRPIDFYRDHGIDTLLGVRAARIDRPARLVELDDGRLVPFDRLLLATGTRNRAIPIPGGDLAGIYNLRTVRDADRIRSQSVAGSRAVVVGMGFIGAEVAASLRQMGAEVVAVDPSPAPLYRVLGEDVGRTIADLHGAHGVRTIFRDRVAAFSGVDRVTGVTTEGGIHLDCDFAVVGIGVVPNTEIAAGAGIDVDNGILVNEYCETNVPGLFSAGDVANHYHPVFQRHIRVEHWQNAIKQGSIAASNMLGGRVSYDDIPWFWSDQYDVNIQYAGFHTTWDQLVVRGQLESRSYLACYLTDGRIDAVVGFNRGREVRRLLPVIKARHQVDTDALRDEDFDLRSLHQELHAEEGPRRGSVT